MRNWEVRLLPYSRGHAHCVLASSSREALERLVASVVPLTSVRIEQLAAGRFRVVVHTDNFHMEGEVTVSEGCPFVVGS